jgi:hypothetical protein
MVLPDRMVLGNALLDWRGATKIESDDSTKIFEVPLANRSKGKYDWRLPQKLWETKKR